MMYLVALILPPVALFATGKVIQAVLNLLIWLFAIVILVFSLGLGAGISFVLWLVVAVHAVFSVHASKADARTQKVIDAVGGDRQE
jgi:hypothetical protein